MVREQLRKIIAVWLKDAMGKKGWDQTVTADAAGLSRVTVWNILNQEVDAGDGTLERLAAALEVDLPDLVNARVAEVRESSSDAYQSDAAYLSYTLETLRALGVAERDSASIGVKLLMLQQAEEIGVPRFGKRATDFIQRFRERLQRGEPLSPDSAP